MCFEMLVWIALNNLADNNLGMVPHDDELFRLLADETNRAVVTLLLETDGEVTVSKIADHLVSQGVAPVSLTGEDDVTRTVLSLHHATLPRLDEAGLVDYDSEQSIVTSEQIPSFDAEWKSIGAFDELREQFGSREQVDGSAIGILEGCETVYEYGRELADTAENELFLIYASDDLLDEACLPHARNALERGVELYAGAKSRGARTFFRDALPEATVWEPQVDWMNDRSRYPKVSRLIFVDRETVVVGLWEVSDDGTKTEVAMIGEGEANPLVVLTRELLGPRLDHLDYQSDDFLGDLPFEA